MVMEKVMIDSQDFLTPATRWWSKETIAVVTGSNKGIGFSVVNKLAELGLTVIVTARDEAKGKATMESLISRYGFSSLHFHQLDISDSSSVEAFASWIREEFGHLDILVNNAAVSFNEIHDNSVEKAEIVMATNFDGTKNLTEALLPMFRRADCKSRILNLSSSLGSINKMRNPDWKRMLENESLTVAEIEEMTMRFLEQVNEGKWENQGWPGIWTAYAVSKLALNSYSAILDSRVRGSNLTVNCYCPGFTKTDMTRGRGDHSADTAAAVAVALVLLPAHILPSRKFFILRRPVISKL